MVNILISMEALVYRASLDFYFTIQHSALQKLLSTL